MVNCSSLCLDLTMIPSDDSSRLGENRGRDCHRDSLRGVQEKSSLLNSSSALSERMASKALLTSLLLLLIAVLITCKNHLSVTVEKGTVLHPDLRASLKCQMKCKTDPNCNFFKMVQTSKGLACRWEHEDGEGLVIGRRKTPCPKGATPSGSMNVFNVKIINTKLVDRSITTYSDCIRNCQDDDKCDSLILKGWEDGGLSCENGAKLGETFRAKKVEEEQCSAPSTTIKPESTSSAIMTTVLAPSTPDKAFSSTTKPTKRVSVISVMKPVPARLYVFTNNTEIPDVFGRATELNIRVYDECVLFITLLNSTEIEFKGRTEGYSLVKINGIMSVKGTC